MVLAGQRERRTGRGEGSTERLGKGTKGEEKVASLWGGCLEYNMEGQIGGSVRDTASGKRGEVRSSGRGAVTVKTLQYEDGARREHPCQQRSPKCENDTLGTQEEKAGSSRQ